MLVKGQKTDDRPEEPEVAQMSEGSGLVQAEASEGAEANRGSVKKLSPGWRAL